MFSHLRYPIVALMLCATPALAGGHVNDLPFLERLGAAEGPDGYDSVTGFASFPPPRPVTEMSITEVLAYQDRIAAAGARSTAVGRYQFIRSTLRLLVREREINPDRLFDGTVQDMLARTLMDQCDFYDSNTRAEPLASCLAGHWAALPMATGSKRGQSRYHGIAGNRAHVPLQEVLDLVEARHDAPPERPTISIEEAFREVQLTAVAIPLRERRGRRD